jgi:hypothetical protein
MEIIYKGTMFEVEIKSAAVLAGAHLYNLAMQRAINVEITANGTESETDDEGNTTTSTKYKLTVYTNDVTDSNGDILYTGSASIPQGIYNLELYSLDSDGNAVIEYYKENYAKVKESSFGVVS